MLKMLDFNTGPLRMSVTNIRAPQSRSHNHRYDQDSENGRGHDQESGKGHCHDQRHCPRGGPFAISFCFPTRVGMMMMMKTRLIRQDSSTHAHDAQGPF